MLYTIVYYVAFLIPLWMLFVATPNNVWHTEILYNGLKSVRFEMVATTFVTGLYLIQLEMKKSLMLHQENLERTIKHRTKELELRHDMQTLYTLPDSIILAGDI